MNVGDKITIGASVNADAGIDRTVTWSTGDATIASVDQTGLVTALKAGTTTIKATSKADASQSASAVITVGGGQGTNGGNAVISISTINQTVCGGLGGCASVPANLANVAGQLDVTLNVDPGSQRLLGVDLILNCTGAGNSGKDTVVATQTLATANVAPAADAAAAPVTLSFNTASFNSTTGATLFKNGACTVKAAARTNSTVGGAVTTTTSTGLSLTLANPDVIVGTVTAGATALNPNTGLSWNGKSVTVNAIPVFFSNRTSAQTIVTFEGRTVHLGAGAQSVTFVDDNDPSKGPVLGGAVTTQDTLDIDGITDANAGAALGVTLIDSNGQAFANAGNILASTASYLTNPAAPATVFTQPFRLDTQKPLPGTLNLGGNLEQGTGTFGNGGAYLNANFRFAADSAAGYRGPDRLLAAANCTSAGVVTPTTQTSNCDFGGVDSVTVQFFTATVASGPVFGTATKTTSAGSLAETNTNVADAAYMITMDRLGNADTSVVCSLARYVTLVGGCGQFSTTQNVTGIADNSTRFGVDKTAPTQAFTAGELNGATFTNAFTPGNYFLTVTDAGTTGGAGVGTYAGPGTVLVAQTRQWNGLRTNFNPAAFENHVASNNANARRNTTSETLVVVAEPGNPCIIGRFNASSANALANAISVFANDGTVLGFCSPVGYTPAAGPSNTLGVPANASNQVGYIRTTIVPSDMANNTGAPFQSTIYADSNSPVIQNVDIPQTIAGNSTVSFPATVNDTTPSRASTAGDIVGSWATMTYATGPVLQYAVTAGPGVAFDNVLTNTATVTPQVPNFIRNLQLNNGTAAPANQTANSSNATSVQVVAIDAAANTSATALTGINAPIPFAGQPVTFTGSATNYATAGFTGGFAITASNANGTQVQNCPAGGCAAGTANPSTITVTATATGASGTFNNPFSTTQLWYRAAGTQTFFLATSAQAVPAGVTSSDNGTNRTWNYAFTFDPPSATPASAANPSPVNLSPAAGSTINIEVMVIGIDSNGNAIGTPLQTITLTNP